MAKTKECPDLGLDAVQKLFRQMGIDEAWSLRTARGFTWWGHEFAQRVWAEAPEKHAGTSLWRVNAETDVLRVPPSGFQHQELLNFYSGFASLSGFVRSPEGDILRLRSSAVFRKSNLDALWPVFAMAAVMQAAEAQDRAILLAEVTGLATAQSHHPDAGPRTVRDDILNVTNQLVIPRGKEPSTWAMVSLFEKEAKSLNAKGIPTTFDRHGLWAKFPFGAMPGHAANGQDSALLHVENRDKHPEFGHGLTLRLHLPFWAEDGRYDSWPLRLNECERDSGTTADFLGSWCVGPNPERRGVLFTCFVPNTLWSHERFQPLVLAMRRRACWVHEAFSGGKFHREIGEEA